MEKKSAKDNEDYAQNEIKFVCFVFFFVILCAILSPID
jgi:hypothetical protein